MFILYASCDLIKPGYLSICTGNTFPLSVGFTSRPYGPLDLEPTTFGGGGTETFFRAQLPCDMISDNRTIYQCSLGGPNLYYSDTANGWGGALVI